MVTITMLYFDFLYNRVLKGFTTVRTYKFLSFCDFLSRPHLLTAHGLNLHLLSAHGPPSPSSPFLLSRPLDSQRNLRRRRSRSREPRSRDRYERSSRDMHMNRWTRLVPFNPFLFQRPLFLRPPFLFLRTRPTLLARLGANPTPPSFCVLVGNTMKSGSCGRMPCTRKGGAASPLCHPLSLSALPSRSTSPFPASPHSLSPPPPLPLLSCPCKRPVLTTGL